MPVALRKVVSCQLGFIYMLHNSDMHILTKKDFPPLLHEIPDPPKKLYIEGSLPPEDYRYLTVVGARHYTNYAKDVIDFLIGGLAGYPVSIVSGLALGVDRLAHETALEYGLHTVAVPGSGLDRSVLYPARHHGLASKILKAGGALLSEYEPKTRATPWMFPQRNRIMAGMAPATLIVEATLKSGTLITSKLATDYNRDVLTVPGSLFSPNTVGPHMLLRLGATPILKSEHILEALHIPITEQNKKMPNLSKQEARVIALLVEPLPREVLVNALDMNAKDASILLSMMELREYISEQSGIITSRI